MSSSSRTPWAMLFLRLGVGGMALLAGFTALRSAHGSIGLAKATFLAFHLGQMTAGVLVVAGIWMPISATALALYAGLPLVNGWLHGVGILAKPDQLFHLIAALASAVGGAGRWGIGR